MYSLTNIASGLAFISKPINFDKWMVKGGVDYMKLLVKDVFLHSSSIGTIVASM